MTQTIAILDYGMGNLHSAHKAFERYCDSVVVTDDPTTLGKADKLVLPGQGAFEDAMAMLRERKLVEVLDTHVKAGKPLMGICLGFQLIFEESFENGHHTGLGYLKGKIVPFKDVITDPSMKIPHMGWNDLHIEKDTPLLENVTTGDYVYFVHSYYLDTPQTSAVAATADYGLRFPAIVSEGNIHATQFHPEKSQDPGLHMVENFCTRC